MGEAGGAFRERWGFSDFPGLAVDERRSYGLDDVARDAWVRRLAGIAEYETSKREAKESGMNM